MKKILVMAFAVLCFSQANSQTFAEWFQQSKTQREYLLKQIAALQVYISYAKKGYDIAQKGLTTIRDIKKGDFNLHQTFFSSLKTVNPQIQQYGKIADIIAMQAKIIGQSSKAIKEIKQSGQFTGKEISYCSQVFNNLLNECIKSIDELLLVTTSGKLEMKDDERLKRIELLYTDMQDKYSFCRSFSSNTGMLALNRLQQHTEINYSKQLNGLR
jgi:hypothetical protein